MSRWLEGYETAWRAPGTGGLASLFTDDATYLQSPYGPPVTGLDAIKRMWDEERDGPGEVFTMATEILAVDGPTAVVRAEVHYGEPTRQEYRDLWVVRLGDDGRDRSHAEHGAVRIEHAGKVGLPGDGQAQRLFVEQPGPVQVRRRYEGHNIARLQHGYSCDEAHCRTILTMRSAVAASRVSPGGPLECWSGSGAQ